MSLALSVTHLYDVTCSSLNTLFTKMLHIIFMPEHVDKQHFPGLHKRKMPTFFPADHAAHRDSSMALAYTWSF